MTASDHATKPLRNTLRERGHPYMALGANRFLTTASSERGATQHRRGHTWLA